jgi:hypothetical protein
MYHFLRLTISMMFSTLQSLWSPSSSWILTAVCTCCRQMIHSGFFSRMSLAHSEHSPPCRQGMNTVLAMFSKQTTHCLGSGLMVRGRRYITGSASSGYELFRYRTILPMAMSVFRFCLRTYLVAESSRLGVWFSIECDRDPGSNSLTTMGGTCTWMVVRIDDLLLHLKSVRVRKKVG